MNKNQDPDALLARLQRTIVSYKEGRLSQRSLLRILKWEMVLAEHDTVTTFLAELQDNPNLDSDVVDEVTRTYTDNVQHWVFPEEPDLSKAVPEALECTFPELIRIFKSARGALGVVLDALVGVNVRLNLRGSYGAVQDARRLLTDEIALLERACEYVGAGTSLAPAFPEEADEGRPLWYSPHGTPLSPKQITWLADLGKESPEISLTYAEGIAAHSYPPQLVTERIRARERQLLRAKELRAFEEQERRAMKETCPRCNSAQGELCRTRAGKETGVHKGRYRIAS